MGNTQDEVLGSNHEELSSHRTRDIQGEQQLREPTLMVVEEELRGCEM